MLAFPHPNSVVPSLSGWVDKDSVSVYVDSVQRMAQLTEAVDSRDPAVGLAAVASLRVLVDELEALHVANARACAWTWQSIADSLGVTRQSVHKKHRGSRRGRKS
jgi:hypothetical protein